jgi:hypothetical protein
MPRNQSAHGPSGPVMNDRQVVHPHESNDDVNRNLWNERVPEIIRNSRKSKTPGVEQRRQKANDDIVLGRLLRPDERPPLADCEENFRHGGWKETRQKVANALAKSGASVWKCGAFNRCGACAHVEWSESKGQYRVCADYCKCRHCQPCANARASLIGRNLERHLEKRPSAGKQYRFITLTLKADGKPLAERLARLNASFKKLRNGKWWKKTQRGGVWMIEVKLNDNNNWHCHLHIISEGYYLPARELSDQWNRVTQGSSVVDVRRLDRLHDACIYVTKYITKGTNSTVWQTDSSAVEFICAMKGVRICSTYGDWRGLKLTETEIDATDWTYVANLSDLYIRAAQGEVHAANLLMILRRPQTTTPTPGP